MGVISYCEGIVVGVKPVSSELSFLRLYDISRSVGGGDCYETISAFMPLDGSLLERHVDITTEVFWRGLRRRLLQRLNTSDFSRVVELKRSQAVKLIRPYGHCYFEDIRDSNILSLRID